MPNFAGDPAGFIFWAKPAGTWVDWTQYVTRPITITRANPGQPARVNVNLWVLGGGLTVPDFMPIRIEDPYMTNPTYPLSDTGLHVRYMNGFAINNSPTIQNNVIQAYTLECVGQDWLWQNPPARPTTTLNVGAPPVWLPNHTYVSSDIVQPNPTNNHKYTCSGGISGTTQPAFPTGAGATVTDGSGATQITWTEAGSAAVSDQDIILQLLDIYYPPALGVITHNSISKLITSVPSFQVDASMTMDDVFKKLATYAPSTGYYAVYPDWPGAGQSVAAGYQIERSPSVNGLIWQCTTPGITGGSVPAGLTSSTQVNQTVTDNTVVWTAVLRTGRWEASCNMVTGQRIEPQLGALNGVWYQVISANGTTAATPPGLWPALGSTVVSGTVTLLAAGVTAVAPVWQMWDPSDNGSHTASWVPDAAWFDSNTQTQTTVAAYSDTPVVQDTLHLHYASLVIKRTSSAYANRWYIRGSNLAFAKVDSIPAQNAVQGLIVSRCFTDTSATGPSTTAECEAVGANLLAVSIMRETADLKSAKVLDPIMIQKLTSAQVVAALLGLNHTYPAVTVQVTLGMGAPVWEIQFGAGYLTDRQDPYSNIRGGRPFAQDTVPPNLVTWDSNPAHGNYFLPGNTVDPVTQTAVVTIVWGEDSADADYFDGYYILGGSNYHHSFARIYYPIQTHTFLGLPINTAMQVFIAAFDHNGNVIRDQNGNAILSASPAFTTAALPARPGTPIINNPGPPMDYSSAQYGTNLYNLFVTVHKANVGDDASHGGWVHVTRTNNLGGDQWYRIPENSAFPYQAILSSYQATDDVYAQAWIIDQYDQTSLTSAVGTHYVIPVNGPHVPVVSAVTQRHDLPNNFRIVATVNKNAPGDDATGGATIRLRDTVTNDTWFFALAGTQTYPVSPAFGDVLVGRQYAVAFQIYDHWNTPSGYTADSLYTVVAATAPATPHVVSVNQFNDNNGFHLSIVVDKSAPGDDASGGGQLRVALSGHPYTYFAVDGNASYPYTFHLASYNVLVGSTYVADFGIIDAFGVHSLYSSPDTSYLVIPAPAAAPAITSPIAFRHNSQGYVATPVVTPGSGADTSNGGIIVWTPTVDGPATPIPHVYVIPPGTVFPATGWCPIDVNVTYGFTAYTIDGHGTYSLVSPQVNLRILTAPPPGQTPKGGWAEGVWGPNGDQVLAGWLPATGFTNSDFAIVPDAAGNNDSMSLQLINLVAFGGYKQIQSTPFAAKPLTSIYVRWGGKADATLCTGRLWVQPQSWTGNEADAPASVGPPIPIGSIQSLGTAYPATPYDGTFTQPAGATQFVFIYRGQNNNHVVTQSIYFSYPTFKPVEVAGSIGTAAIQPIHMGAFAVIPGNTDNGIGLLENGSLEVPNLTNTFPAGCTIDSGIVQYMDIDIAGGSAGDGKRFLRLGGSAGTHRVYLPFMTWAKGRETLLGALKYSLNTLTGGPSFGFGLASFDRNKAFISRAPYTNPLDQTALAWSVVTWQDQVGSMDPNIGIPLGTVYVRPYVELVTPSGTPLLDVDVFKMAAGGIWHYASGLQGVNGSGQYSGSLDLVNSTLAFSGAGTIKTITGSNQSIVMAPDGTGTFQVNGKTKLGAAAVPLALAHLAAGGTGVNSAPLKMDSGSLLTTPETGVTEYEGNAFYDTPKVNRHARVLSGAPITAPVTVAATVTETVVFTEPIGANELAVGRDLMARLLGRYTTINGTDTFTWRLRMGGLTGTILASGTSVAGIVSKASLLIVANITVTAIGSGGTVWWFVESHLNNVEADTHANAAVNINTTIVEDLVLTIQWSAATAGNTLTLDQGYVQHDSK